MTRHHARGQRVTLTCVDHAQDLTTRGHRGKGRNDVTRHHARGQRVTLTCVDPAQDLTTRGHRGKGANC